MHYQPNKRGFAAIGLVNPKSSINIGSVLRAGACYDVAMIAHGGPQPIAPSWAS